MATIKVLIVIVDLNVYYIIIQVMDRSTVFANQLTVTVTKSL